LCESILGAVERRAAGRRVSRVRVRVGTLHRVVAPALDQAFALVSAGGVAFDAVVDLVVVPAICRCRACGLSGDAEDVLAVCAGCGSPDVELSGGDELTLESIELAANE
jgi:hydrogenase nickel incorporation protein HypA/HybF